jgi:uncharacterized membrane protein
MKNLKLKNLVLLSLFIAIEIVMVLIPFLGFIPIGVLRATTLHIPVIICGIILGKKYGTIMGFVFGMLSLLTNTLSPTISSFVFSPFLSGSLFSIIIAIIPRMAIGYVSGLIYQILYQKNSLIAMSLASFLASLVNTILVMSGIYFLFGERYATMLGRSFNELLPYIITVISTQGILEAIVGMIISVMVSKVLIQVYN